MDWRHAVQWQLAMTGTSPSASNEMSPQRHLPVSFVIGFPSYLGIIAIMTLGKLQWSSRAEQGLERLDLAGVAMHVLAPLKLQRWHLGVKIYFWKPLLTKSLRVLALSQSRRIWWNMTYPMYGSNPSKRHAGDANVFLSGVKIWVGYGH